MISGYQTLYFLAIPAIITLSCANSKQLSPTNTNAKIEEQPKIPEPNIYIEPENTSNNRSEIKYEDHVYVEGIDSPQLYVSGSVMSYPVLFLNDNKKLELHFDNLDNRFHVYSYQLIHCNANWEPSGLVQQEYMSGFMNGFFEEYDYSYNTLQPYIHYNLTFPNDEIRFTKSGNYIIKVYEDNDPDKLVLTRRFFVVDKKIKIKTDIHMATLARHRDYKQEIDFTLDLGNYLVTDPYLDLKVVLLQNRRWDNAITSLKPLFVRTPELVYNYEDDNLFDGNNEYRFFDIKDLRFQSMNIDGIQIMNNKTHVFVLPEEPRSFKRYLFQQDLNGRRLIKRDRGNEDNIEADYVETYFTLKREAPIPNGEVYVFGELSDWKFQNRFKMKYVEVNNEYVLQVPLKQGFYNYNYAVLRNGSIQGDLSVIEGTHSETENDYYFFVYHRWQGEIYDRLVGFEIKNSNNVLD